MPELPEIETIKLQLQKVLIGQTIVDIKQLHKKSLHGDRELVNDKKITGIKRFGKMLILDLEGKLDIAIHFKMSGQLILTKGKQEQRIVGGHPTEDWVGKLPSNHTRGTFRFKSGDTMYFNDQRLFGWVKIMTQDELKNLPFLKNLGPEIWNISAAEFFKLLQKKKKPVKVAIMDQEMISGVGNIYANDALWEAKIHPQTRTQSLTIGKAKLLQNALVKVLKEGIKYGGATAADAKYIDLHGLGGTYQEHFRVYDRKGQGCLRCKAKIKKITLGGRGTYFCPACQPA